ncbi:helix-turn-helix domain-containing protein [Polycladidibacter hongkongensis]|uniref:helix-turn-helix domain-containing protein n=1 Tax=Polycladidibacter hongkongensis TaxID=1647556 RepID=UPI0008363372|nr:helix-turn-helix domain-containing protein [Pseudovibrio hongkongensis]
MLKKHCSSLSLPPHAIIKKRGHKHCRRTSRHQAAAWLATAQVALAFGLSPQHLHSPTRGFAEVAKARQVCIYLMHVALGYTLAEAAGLFGRDRTTAAHACRVVEDMRDDLAFDSKLSLMEEQLRRFAEGAKALGEAKDPGFAAREASQ